MQAFATQQVFEQTGGVALMGRGTGLTGTNFAQTDFTSITLKIFDMSDPGTPINGDDGDVLTVSDVIFNSLVTNDARWTLDNTGYNFLYETAAADLPSGGRRYRFEFALLPVGADDPFWAVFEVPTLGLFSA